MPLLMRADGSGGVSSERVIGRVRGVLLAIGPASRSNCSSYDALRLTFHRDGPDDLVASAAGDLLHVPRSQVNNDQACSGFNLWARLPGT